MTVTRHHLDPDVFAAARKALDDSPGVPQGVRVHVDRGIVTLTGSVQWPRERTAAEAVVRRIDGVLGVKNEISVDVVIPEGLGEPESR